MTLPLREGNRSLPMQECSSIQNFLPGFQLLGNESDAEKVIGNAVPVKLAEYVARRLLNYMQMIEFDDVTLMPGQLFEARPEYNITSPASA